MFTESHHSSHSQHSPICYNNFLLLLNPHRSQSDPENSLQAEPLSHVSPASAPTAPSETHSLVPGRLYFPPLTNHLQATLTSFWSPSRLNLFHSLGLPCCSRPCPHEPPRLLSCSPSHSLPRHSPHSYTAPTAHL